MTCSAITTAHMPSAKIDSDTAAINSRYSRYRNGASTRQPAGATGCSESDRALLRPVSYCVLTDRWLPTTPHRVERFSVYLVSLRLTNYTEIV